jgi:hypothetical protein
MDVIVQMAETEVKTYFYMSRIHNQEVAVISTENLLYLSPIGEIVQMSGCSSVFYT